MSQEAVTMTEAAELLSVSRWTIWRLIRAGKLEAFRVGRCKRIHLSAIRRFERLYMLPDGASDRSRMK